MSYDGVEIGSATAEAIRVNPYSVGFCNECWADKTAIFCQLLGCLPHSRPDWE